MSIPVPVNDEQKMQRAQCRKSETLLADMATTKLDRILLSR